MKKVTKEQDDDSSIVCIHCHKRILQAKLIGLTLICPSCGKPTDSLLDKSILL